MSRKIPLFYSAVLLTAVNLVLRMVGTVFGIYLSRKIGAEGIGLLQLTMSVGNLAMIAGIGGIRTAAMYLTAEELGFRRPQGLRRVLSGCMVYSLACSLGVGSLLYLFAPIVARNWVGNAAAAAPLRLFAFFLPTGCLCALMTGFFTGQNRIGTLAVVEIGEQLVTMAVTLELLRFWAGTDGGRACCAVILGSALGTSGTLLVLVILFLLQRNPTGPKSPIAKRVLSAAGPLALADTAKSGISTLENLMVPKRLALAVPNPLALFGVLTGMVFPVLLFPACILFGLCELLIPEVARCRCSGQERRIQYLMHKSLKLSLVYGLFFGGLLFLLAPELCSRLYHNDTAGTLLRLFAPLVPMLYCDAITDALTKGLGQQQWAMRFNIFTSALDVAMLFFLLPVYGVRGYFISFLISHAINFYLSIRHLLRITGEKISWYMVVVSFLCGAGSLYAAGLVPTRPGVLCFMILFPGGLYLTNIVGDQELRWFRHLIRRKPKNVSAVGP